MLLSLDDSGPIYQQVYRAVKQAILSGQIASGTRLSSTRDMAEDLGVSRNTVMLAYEQLLAEGYVVGRVGSGTFVASHETLPSNDRGSASPTVMANYSSADLSNYARRAVYTPYTVAGPREHPFRFDFKHGIPAVTDFPFEIWRQLLSNRARASSPEAFMYAPPEGTAPLREAIARYVHRSRRVECTPDQIIITNGSQQAFDLIARALLDPGDITVIEDPSYPGARDVFLAAGSQVIPCPVDDQGMQLDTMPPAARRSRLVYVTPSHQFPTGVVMSLQRRLALLRWARECGAFVVEDDYDGEFRYDSKPIEAVQSLDPEGPIIYVGTLSKTLSPSLRTGYMVVPQALIRAMRTLKFLSDRHTSTLQQNVLTDFIEHGHFERHLRRVRRNNALRRSALLDALHRSFGEKIAVEGANAGLHMMVWFRDVPADQTGRLVAIAEQNRIGVYAMTQYYIAQPARAGLLLGYAALDETEIRRGVELLADCLTPELSQR